MSIVAQYWVFTLAMHAIFIALDWKAFEDPKYVFGCFIVFVIAGLVGFRFRCPHCGNPIIKRPTTQHRLGYIWAPPTSRSCRNCGARL